MNGLIESDVVTEACRYIQDVYTDFRFSINLYEFVQII